MHRLITGGLVGLALVLSPISVQAQTPGVVVVADDTASEYRPGSHQVWTQTNALVGTGSTRSELFTVTTAPWHFKWNPIQRGAGVVVYDARTDQRVLSLYGTSSTPLLAPLLTPGTYYLRTYGTGTWTAETQELR